MKKNILFPILILLTALLLGYTAKADNINMFHGTQLVNEGNFYDQGGLNGNYPATTLGAITLTMESEVYDDFGSGVVPSVLQFNFSFFALGFGDTLFIYDGQDQSAPLIGAYNGVSSPGFFRTTTKYVTFVFSSDGIADLNGLNAGWRAKFSNYFTSPYVYNLSSALPFTEYSTCNAILYDSGGPTGNFASGENNTIVFTSQLGTYIKAERISFNVGSNVLEIWDGNLVFDPTNARRIGYFKSGYIPPDALISSSPSMSFRFVTTTIGTGFRFNISCVQEIYKPDPTESACPRVVLGPYVTTGTFIPQDTIVFNCNDPMILLQADINAPGPLTNDYMVQSIPYNPPFAWYGAGMTQVPTTQDDYWLGPKGLTPTINPSGMPFSFAFYGSNYSNCVPGTNAAISFNNISMGSAGWQYNQTIPNTADASYSFISGSNYKNSIFGVFQDTYPGAGSPPPNRGIYFGNHGDFPCRTFVFSFYRLPQFSCTSDNMSTYQMVMYEGSNIIDVYVQERTVCSTWNNGSGLIGVLNGGGNQAVIPPGRNTGPWTTTNEAWRFIPISPTNYTVTWYKTSTIPANLIANNNTDKRVISVSPDTTTNYIAKLEFLTSSNITYTLYDTIKVIVDRPAIQTASDVPSVCPGEPAEISVHAVNPNDEQYLASFEWRDGANVVGNTQTVTVNPTVTTTYTAVITYQNQCQNTDTVTVQVPILDKPVIVGDTIICEGERSVLTATDAVGTYLWNTGATTQAIIVSPSDTSDFIVNVTTDIGCITKDTITVYVHPTPSAGFSPNPPHVYVENGEGPINFVNLSQMAQNYYWNFGDTYSIESENVSEIESPIHIYTRAGKFKVSLLVETEFGCMDSTSQFVVVEVPYFFYAPNAFTPNNDGVNDYFYTSGEGVDPDNFDMCIFNRFGNLIFRSKTPFDYWDGRTADGSLAPAGVYVYLITTYDMDGNPKRYEGSVNLIR
jgi:gliding motility-associated-like protein